MRCVVALLVAMLGCYRDTAPATTPANKPRAGPAGVIANSDPLAYLPENSEIVVVVDARTVRASAAWKSIELILRPRLETAFAAFVQRCNFDPIAQLRGLSLGMRDLGGKPTGVFVVRGYHRADVLRCIDAARAQDPRKLTIDNGVVTVPNEAVFTFVDDTTLVSVLGPAANSQTLAAVIDGGAPLRLVASFGELASKVERSHAWLVITRDASTLGSLSALGARPVGLMTGIDFRSDVQGHMRLRFDQPDQAAHAVATVQAQLAQITAMFPGIDVVADDIDAVVNLRMDQSQLAMVVRMMIP